MPIHICINQTENNSLVSYQCLIMTFRIRDRLFILSTVGYFPEHTGRLPVLVNLFLDSLDPVIRDVHSHTVIKSVTAIFYFGRKSRHTGNFFSNRDSLRIDLMNQLIRQCQVANGIAVLMTIEVISVITECFSQPVAIIQHRRHTVKTESVKLIFFQPVFTVGQ